MREIRFRAWDKTENKMHYLEIMDICFEYSSLTFQGNKLDGICEWPEGDDTHIENQVIMQFTGLKDKNSVEIYENDIVKTKIFPNGEWLGVIKYFPNMMYFGIENYDGGHLQFTDLEHPLDIEIIGNSFQNPELLEPPTA